MFSVHFLHHSPSNGQSHLRSVPHPAPTVGPFTTHLRSLHHPPIWSLHHPPSNGQSHLQLVPPLPATYGRSLRHPRADPSTHLRFVTHHLRSIPTPTVGPSPTHRHRYLPHLPPPTHHQTVTTPHLYHCLPCLPAPSPFPHPVLATQPTYFWSLRNSFDTKFSALDVRLSSPWLSSYYQMTAGDSHQ